jgi:hypothetical protein
MNKLLSRLLRRINRELCMGMFLVLAIGASAQKTMLIDVATKYGLSYADGDKTVSQKWAAGQDTVVLKFAWGKWRREGMPYATFRSRYVGSAVAKDCAWFNEQESFLNNNWQNTYTFADWSGCPGKYLMNATVQLPRGGMRGCSSFGYYGNGGDHGQYATEFVMDDATWWTGSATDRRVFEAPNASRTDNYAYNEAINLTDFRIIGPVKSDGITRVGIYLSRLGSTSYVDRIVSNGFTKGWLIVDGCPGYFGTIKSFQSDVGFSGEGTWGAILKVGMLETDGCKRSFQFIANAQGQAGGVVRMGLKVEDGVTNGLPIANTIAGWIEGQYDIEVWGNYTYQNGAKPQHLFVVNPTLGGGANQNARLEMSGKGYGGWKLLKNMVTGSEWTGPGEATSFKAEHYAANDVLTTACPSITKIGTTTPPVDPGPVTPPSSGMKASASVNNVQAELDKITDGSRSTAWLAGTSMAVGQWVQVDYGTTATRSTVSFDIAESYFNSYPRTFDVQTSTNGTNWTTRKTGVAGAYPTSTASFTGVSCRYIRIVVKTPNQNWLCIHSWR